MKKVCKRVISFCVAFLMLTSAVSASALNIIEDSEVNLYTIDTPYEYPIKQGSEEWFALDTPQERTSAFYVPEKIIEQMTTEALLLTVMSNPYFIDIYAFSTIEQGVEMVANYVSGLAELVNRPDFFTEVQALTQQEFCLHFASTDSDSSGRYSLEVKLLNSIYRSLSGADDTIITLGTPYTITTPNESTITGILNQTYDDLHITIADAREVQAGFLNNYPSAQLITDISDNTSKYNCHSYAWYSRLPSNNFWFEDPTPYMTDGSYIRGTAAKDAIVYWSTSSGGSVHSGVIVTPASGGVASIVNSKWEYTGVFQHYVNDCPYSNASYGTSTVSCWVRNS